MAATLRRDVNAQIDMASGGLGELRVTVDGRDAFVGNRLLYPRPGRVVAAVKQAIAP